jgi:NAD(P)-dependent dehydrogenase (short-subunit alcohol dehydrogenase family)
MANYLVIAASSSIGKATTELLREAGHSVYTTARSDTKITPDALLDASNFEQVADVFLQAKQHLGNIDGVVNFAGSLLLKSAKSTTREEYDAVISSSLTTAFATVRSAAKEMSSGGSVVLISSAAAKAGIIGLMLSAAATYAENNLRFNVVSPGLVDTDLTRRITNSTTALEYSLGMHPLGRVGKPMDIARAVLFFLDPLNTWITGQVLNVDGGLATLKTKR